MSKQPLLPSEIARMSIAKFPAGKKMTIEEVAEVVGQDFKEMNVNPPPEVVALKEKMQGKSAQKHRFPRTAYLDAAKQQGARHFLPHILAALRTQYLMYQTAHWQSNGPQAYSNHLLFQRLYESVQEEIDLLAEKIVGYVGEDCVGLQVSVSHIQSYTTRWCAAANPFERGLQSEKDVQKLLKVAYDSLKAEGSLPLGLDDWLMSTANAHETNMYLLQQALKW